MNLCRTHEHGISRRRWITGVAGALAAAPGGSSSLADAPASNDRRQVLFIWLDGGLSQLESWDPKPNTRFGGPFRSIQTSVPGIRISELLPRSASQMDRLAIVRSLCTKDNSHSAGVARIQRGDPKNRGVVYPYFGSAVAKLLGPGTSGLPPYVWIKPGGGGFITQDAGFLGPRFGAIAFGDGKPPENLLRVKSLSESEDAERLALRDAADRRYSQRRRRENVEANLAIFGSAEQLQRRLDLFDESKVSQKDVARYGSHEFGRHMLAARRMLEAGVRFVKVNSYGWDTHGDNFNGHANMVPKFDQAFAAMIEDLADRGMLDDVLVVAMSEFGRTPRVNGHVGRDHWPEAWSFVMSGRGIRRGIVVGETNEQGTHVRGEEHDIGHIFHTWFRALSVDPAKTDYDNAGQPLPIAHDDCRPILELLA